MGRGLWFDRLTTNGDRLTTNADKLTTNGFKLLTNGDKLTTNGAETVRQGEQGWGGRRQLPLARLMTVDAPLAPTSPTGHVVRLLQHTDDACEAAASRPRKLGNWRPVSSRRRRASAEGIVDGPFARRLRIVYTSCVRFANGRPVDRAHQ